MGLGTYYYFGLINNLIRLNFNKEIYFLDFNIDGWPIYKSRNISFWPILGKVYGTDDIFIIAIYCGPNKPPLDDFLKDFVEELLICLNTGILIESKKITFKIRSFICDTPARAYLKNIKGHNGYYGCDKCECRGFYIGRKMTFPELHAQLRTNERFKMKENVEHHKGDTTLLKTGIDMIS